MTSLPLAGVEISSDSMALRTNSDSSGNYILVISANRRKTKSSLTASLIGYFDQRINLDHPDTRLSQLVSMDSTWLCYPQTDLDSISGDKIHKNPDTLASYKDGVRSVIDLLRNEGLISEKTGSNFINDSYAVQVCLIIDQFGHPARIEINVDLPTSVIFSPPKGYDDGHIYYHRQKLIEDQVMSVIESMNWKAASHNGNKVSSQLSIHFIVP